MTDSNSKRNPIDELADSFVSRYRQGERPSLTEYTNRYPDLAEEILEVFPALVAMEQVDADLNHGLAQTRTADERAIGQLDRLGDFQIIREVGRGGMGIVYEAEQESLGRRVALKVLPKQMLLDPKHKNRFTREAKVAANLHHTNIVPVFGVGEHEGMHYYAMQFILGLGLDQVLVDLREMRKQDGSVNGNKKCTLGAVKVHRQVVHQDVSAVAVAQSLVTGQFAETAFLGPGNSDADDRQSSSDHTSEVRESSPSGTPVSATRDTATGRLFDTFSTSGSVALPGQTNDGTKLRVSRNAYWQSVARVGVQVAEALQYAHGQGILHRDIKPSNLLLDTRGTVWVTDFGLAKGEDHENVTRTGDIVGTLRYMAPEMFSGHADARTDVYAIGLTLYELLTLQPAFGETDQRKLIGQATRSTPQRLRKLDPHIPRDLETIVHKAIDRDPSHRYQTAGQLAEDLQHYLEDEPIRARRISPVARFQRWCRRNPAVATLTSAVALLLLTAAVGSTVAAMKFDNLADNNATLAVDLKGALDDAESNLTLARQQEQQAKDNHALAAAEQERAEGNLDLALEALDSVYLEAIGEQKLLGPPLTSPDQDEPAGEIQRTDLSDFEKELLKRGLVFYNEFAKRNRNTSRAPAQSARAYYRVALLQVALNKCDDAKESLRESIHRYEALIRNEPENHQFHHELGKAYFGLARIQPKWDDAQRLYAIADKTISAAIKIKPQEAEYQHSRSEARYGAGDYRHAQLDAERATELAPDRVEFRLTAAKWYTDCPFQYKNLKQAILHGKRAVELDSINARAHAMLGKAFRYVDGRRALAHLSTAIELDPTQVEAFSTRARFYFEQKEYERALLDANESVRLDPKEGYLRRAGILRLLGRFDEAKDDFAAAEKLIQPGDRVYADLLHRRGALHVALQDYASAERDYTRAIEQSPLTNFYYANRSVARFYLGKYDQALQDVKTSLELLPGGAWALFPIPSHLVATCPDEDVRDGLLALAQDTMKTSRSSDCWAFYADTLTACGRYDDAEHAYQRAIDLGLRDQPSVYAVDGHVHLYRFALLQAWRGNREGFRRTCLQLLNRHGDTNDPAIAHYAAWTCSVVPHAVGNYEQAISLAEKGLAAQPGSPHDVNELGATLPSHLAQRLTTLGAALYRAGRYEEAAGRLEEADRQNADPKKEVEHLSADAWYFLAMAHHALGHAEQSRKFQAQANDWTNKYLAEKEHPLLWNRKLTLELLRSEANTMLGPADSDGAPKQAPPP